MAAAVWLLLLASFTQADFGDTVDPTFNCPALTTCAQVCVATVDDCPSEMACPNFNETLCADGSCASVCDDDEELETPCAFDCAPVACHRIDDTFDQCQEKYGHLYDNETNCGELESLYETELLTFTEPAYIVGYVWASAVTLFMLLWCAVNQRLLPVQGSTQTLQVDAKVTNTNTDTTCTQTGYKIHPIGLLLFVLVCLTFWGWSACMIFLTLQYYKWNEQWQVDGLKLHFEDEEQLLKTFIIVWGVGFAWCFALKWPYSISSLFLRRCNLRDATHVAVFLKQKQEMKETAQLTSTWSKIKKGFETLFAGINSAMAFVFSDVDAPLRNQGIYQYCKVQKDPTTGTRSFVFLLRRYNLVDRKDATTMDKTEEEEEETEDAENANTQTSQNEMIFLPGSWTVGETLGDIARKGDTESGLSEDQVAERYQVIGRNIIEMEQPSFWKVLGEEFNKPFYTYQLYMVWTWFPLYYFYMAMVIAFTITISAITVSIFHYRNLCNLYKITHVEGKATVLRNGAWTQVDQTSLVPGDIVKVTPGVTYCDMVLLSGNDTLLDESALTGEATPMVKTPLDTSEPKTAYAPGTHKRHTISAGTTVLEAEEAKAIVMKTASYTAKGELLREIFSFRRHGFKFDQEVYIVMGILILYAIVGFCIVIALVGDEGAVVGFFYGIYVVASAIPPLLPTTFTVSVGVSDLRLAKKRIACANSESILIAGKVSLCFFDKTGTITKQGLDFQSAKPADNWQTDTLTTAMSCCHSVARTKGGQLIGNPVDKTMFLSSGASFREGEGSSPVIMDKTGGELEIVRHFDFDHHRMTQSVIVKLPDGTFVAFVKGSGESVSKICQATSLPSDFHSSLRQSASEGVYQISVATKPIDAATVASIVRDDVEKDCTYLGVINFLNTIREETPDVIRQLSDGSVESTVVTGDNTLVGIRVAREAGIMSRAKKVVLGTINTEGADGEIVWTDETGMASTMPSRERLETNDIEIALSGSAWLALLRTDPKLAKYMAPFVRVFGRCTPHDKVSVVDTFVELGFITCMVGDGGNDCGALKAAHVGVALSDAEASICSPFTSMDRSITSVVEVLKEGRCALASAFAVYKFIIMYGQITTMNQIMNAYFQITFAEWNWVWIDGVWPITLAYTLPLARAAKSLAKTRPTASILGLQTVMSVFFMITFHFIFTVIALAVLFQQDWFQCRQWVPTDLLNALVIGDNYETQVIFLVTGAQYISSAIALNFGYEFRAGWFRNYVFVLLVIACCFIHTYIIFVPSKLSCFWRVNCVNENVVGGVTGGFAVIPIQNSFNTTMMPDDFQWKIYVIIAANTVAVSAFEYFGINGIRRYFAAKRLAAEEEEAQSTKTSGVYSRELSA
ncbi:Probable cation-transporting ATPase 13A4 [Seminavis robusta]|uniref:Probable cation-transporting ATPase 13A4 n=1 Tax=Seminavis robusta TaxID=568900 RepID=A0A9N8EK46_9STRA|nr:Probable cation-transporting ATPase 13A4 [Seminavis robusta]|eukprot:Sro1316_g262130.1 Probable cation-transporting ATPase 13A4 (1363) ;mRNA; r:9349-13607